MGAICGLSEAEKLWISEVKLVMDSELVIKQLQWLYKVKDAGLKVLNQKAKSIIAKFKKVEYLAVLREKNMFADKLVNEAIDERRPALDMQTSSQQALL